MVCPLVDVSILQGVKPQGLQRIHDDGLRQLVQLCLSFDPNDRPEARVLLKHPFFVHLRKVHLIFKFKRGRSGINVMLVKYIPFLLHYIVA